MTRVFLVDDSAFVRRALTRVLAIEPAFTVVGEAANGADALAKIPAADPDLVTLDVAMPGMDGLQLLPALLRWKPTLKVLMLSAHTSRGAEATMAALAAGAVDFIDKTTFNVMDLEYLRREVVDRLKALAPAPRAGGGGVTGEVRGPGPAELDFGRCELCVIGASTGGPAAVQRILQALPARFPLPVVIVQHMPVGFTRPFAERLASLAACGWPKPRTAPDCCPAPPSSRRRDNICGCRPTWPWCWRRSPGTPSIFPASTSRCARPRDRGRGRCWASCSRAWERTAPTGWRPFAPAGA